MNEEKKSKVGSVQVHTFKSWGKAEIIGFEADGNNVVAVWCKLYSKHIEKIKANNTLIKGKAKEDALIYTKKVAFVKKGNIDRHLASAGHKTVLSNESISTNKNVNGKPPTQGQTSIETSLKEPTKLTYKKLFEVAYNLAEGMLQFSKFKVLVKCLRYNKVNLISGRDDHCACEEMYHILLKVLETSLP